MAKTILLFSTVILITFTSFLFAQQSSATAEDSLNSSNIETNSTTIGGYGNAFYQRDFNAKTSIADLERVVLFVGHSFGTISFFAELEMEDAKVTGGEEGGEIAFEQAYLKFNLDESHYIAAGLFLPRLGILNENHLPNQFNGNERTQVETYIIPSTWRELGIGFYGSSGSVPLNYSVAIVNGLSSEAFEHGSGIREGRFEGKIASANNLAITGGLQYFINDLKLQISGYYGGTVGLAPDEADVLGLSSGIFGTPVILGEGDIQYQANGFSFRALGTIISIPDASKINKAYDNNTPKSEYGVYAEIAYDIFHRMPEMEGSQLVAFIRYEKLDMNSSVPGNGIIDGTLNQQHIVTGLNYYPINNVVIKVDIRVLNTDDQNPLLAESEAGSYKTSNTFLNLGIGFSF